MRPMVRWWRSNSLPSAGCLLLLMLLGLGLRLLVWRWREFYALSGDEREYFQQALTLLQGRGYVELPLMRPPLYTIFLAVVFQLFDSQVQLNVHHYTNLIDGLGRAREYAKVS